MKQLKWTVCLLGLCVITSTHAEPMRGKKAVDLDAAAKATAALYANMRYPTVSVPLSSASASSVSVTLPTAVAPVPQSPLLPNRPSPLLPAAASVSAVPTPAPTTEVWQGAYQCAHAEKVQLRPDTQAEQVQLQWKGQSWRMRRIDSSSGAMRLEDAQAHVVWIQLPNKSMLLDQRQGKRLLDDCQHAVQVQTAIQMKTNPPPTLFDTSGMGR